MLFAPENAEQGRKRAKKADFGRFPGRAARHPLSRKCVSGSEKGVFWKRGLFRKVHILEILENPQTLENKGEPDHLLKNLEILEIPEIHAVKRPLLAMTPFSGPESIRVGFWPNGLLSLGRRIFFADFVAGFFSRKFRQPKSPRHISAEGFRGQKSTIQIFGLHIQKIFPES